MSLVFLLSVAMAGELTAPEIEAGLRAAFQGVSGCHRVRIEVEQEASLPLFSLDRERYEVRGILEGTQWRDVTWKVLEDTDTDVLVKGPYPFATPAVGVLPRKKEIEERPIHRLVAAFFREDTQVVLGSEPGTIQRTLALRDGVTLHSTGEGMPLRKWSAKMEGKLQSGSKSVEGLTWEHGFDAQGMPEWETFFVKFSKGWISARFETTQRYHFEGACASVEPG